MTRLVPRWHGKGKRAKPISVNPILTSFWPDPQDQASRGIGLERFGTDQADRVQGSDGDDALYGFAAVAGDWLHQDAGAGGDSDTLQGGAGNDTLDGGKGLDWLYGGAGDDRFYLSQGSDHLFGGAGRDQFAVDYPPFTPRAPNIYDGGTGVDFIYLDNSGDTPYAVSLADPTDWQVLPDGTRLRGIDHMSFLNTGGACTITGGDHADQMGSYGSGSALFYGGGGRDDLTAQGLGADHLFGGDGRDRLSAFFLADRHSAVELDGGAGQDWLFLVYGNPWSTAITIDMTVAQPQILPGNLTLRGFERLWFQGGTGSDTVSGGACKDVLYGGDGNDSLRGGGQDDQLDGRALQDGDAFLDGDDTLRGGAGDDNITGGTGRDHLYGGAGMDRLVLSGTQSVAHGGPGDDVFVLECNFQTTFRIADFGPGDRINLTHPEWYDLLGWNLPEAAFVHGTSATDRDDRVIYDQATGRVWIDRDGTGSEAAHLFLRLAPGTDLTAADFLML